VSLPTDVEISRALNALATTINDQRVREYRTERFQAIVDGALAGERKLLVVQDEGTAGRVVTADGGRLVAEVTLSEGAWDVMRRVGATGSEWAVPQPEASQAEGG